MAKKKDLLSRRDETAMMGSIKNFEYLAPRSLKQAFEILDRHEEAASVLAGGTDLVVQMKQGVAHPACVVDVKKIPDLNVLDWNLEDGLHIGAAVPISRLLSLPVVWEKYNILAQACSGIGSMQLRNRATVGGNICNAAPSADSASPLLCLGAKVVMVSSKGLRTIPMEDFFLAPGKTARIHRELLVEIVIPTPESLSSGCYLKHGTREKMDIAVAGVASFLSLSAQDRKLKAVRIALGAVAPRPMRAPRAEAILTKNLLNRQNIEAAAEQAANEAEPISDLRSSAEYRREIVKVLTRRTLNKACESLGVTIQ
jgi:aerobic carbon-monoxide dehydrogenase medium subunit